MKIRNPGCFVAQVVRAPLQYLKNKGGTYDFKAQ